MLNRERKKEKMHLNNKYMSLYFVYREIRPGAVKPRPYVRVKQLCSLKAYAVD